jgi:hypothetical protein
MLELVEAVILRVNVTAHPHATWAAQQLKKRAAPRGKRAKKS